MNAGKTAGVHLSKAAESLGSHMGRGYEIVGGHAQKHYSTASTAVKGHVRQGAGEGGVGRGQLQPGVGRVFCYRHAAAHAHSTPSLLPPIQLCSLVCFLSVEVLGGCAERAHGDQLPHLDSHPMVLHLHLRPRPHLLHHGSARGRAAHQEEGRRHRHHVRRDRAAQQQRRDSGLEEDEGGTAENSRRGGDGRWKGRDWFEKK